jgi:hypothetical protein
MKEGTMKRFRLILLAGTALGLVLGAAAPADSGTSMRAIYRANLKLAAPSAFAAAPELAVQQASYKLGAPANPGIVFVSDAANDPTAKITIFSPAGYTSTLGQAPGTTVGHAWALVLAGALGGAPLPLSGPVVVGNPADPALAAAYAQCKSPADPITPQEVLVLNTSLQGQTIQVPDFLNTAGPYVTQEICLPPPQTAAFNAKVVIASFTINGLFTNASAAGPYEWIADVTPYAGTTPDAAGTVETRTYVGLPSSFSFKRLKSKSSVVKFGGALKVRGLNPAGIRLRLYYAAKPKPAPTFLNPSAKGLGYPSTNKNARTKGLKSNGSYAITRPKVKKRTYFQMRLDDEYGLDISQGCLTPSPTGQPIPCVLELISPMTANQITVKPPPKKKKKHHH